MLSNKQFTRDEVAQHDKDDDLWVIINGNVYDVSKFAALHPGGMDVLLDAQTAGQDATEAFFGLHRHEVLLQPQYARLQIGTVAGEPPQIVPRALGALSNVPYSEPAWLTPGYHSPYFTDKHRVFQAAVRQLVEEFVLPDAQAREEDGQPPSQAVWDKLAETNILAMRLGPGPHLKGRKLMGGLIEPEELTIIYCLILTQEFNRLNARGYADALGNGGFISLPPLMQYGKSVVHTKVVNEFLAGKKFVALALSEAYAGSDVSQIKTYAGRTDAGWVVNGTKKWITNGTFATYFTVGCRTEKGMVLLLIERGPGVKTKPIKTSYSATAGTAFVTFDNVLVPYENQIGEDGNVLSVILSNFNRERWNMAAATIASHRIIVEECLKWATQRKVFGKPLSAQAVVRSKLAAMITRVESAQAWIESLSYQACFAPSPLCSTLNISQMDCMSEQEAATILAGPLALLKNHATRGASETAADAVQIFGGRGITRTGMGKHIEHFHRTAVFETILGGAESVMDDLAVRQALKKMPKSARL
ncbi:acyl-CoA dehydrogenase [Mycena amicta]|nr:acyl-CoA dehydrogenase [Mycena amicta]